MIDPVRQLEEWAREAAGRRGWFLVVEYSDRSEAVYLHVRRGSRWYGWRLAAHEPVYACSRDYEQVPLPLATEGEVELESTRRRLLERLERGGLVVADPREVRRLLLARLRSKHALTRRWRMSGAEQSEVRHRANVIAAWSAEIEDEDG